MRKRKSNATRNAIIEAAARAGFVQAYADYCDERGKGGPGAGGDWMDYAPKTPSKARTWAKKLVAKMEQFNDLPVDEMYRIAAAMEGRHSRRPTAEDFGHYTAMQSMGHGVAWSDDHPHHGFRIPYAQFNMMGARSFWAEVSERPGLGTVG